MKVEEEDLMSHWKEVGGAQQRWQPKEKDRKNKYVLMLILLLPQPVALLPLLIKI